MNKHFYRIIFNKARGIMMVVAEIVKRHQGEGRSSQKATSTASHSKVTAALKPLSFLTFVALGMVSIVTHSQASTIISDNSAAQSQRPTIIERPNGPTVVNIQEANKAGVSHNKYNQFDVSRDGVILNNSAQSSNTQLGGNIAGNSNLAHSGGAKVILNEINSANASQLNGKIEVAGQTAQVVIANAAGITCNGCGFINARSATLTTGSAIISEDGKLQGYHVEQGNITINGEFDSREQDYTDLIARTVNINGQIYANQMMVIAGKNNVYHNIWVYDDGSSAANVDIDKIYSDEDKPQLAIDVAALGGMYANKIKMSSTETGVGVRNAGTLGVYGEYRAILIGATGKITNTGLIYAENLSDENERQRLDSKINIDNSSIGLSSQQTVNHDSNTRSTSNNKYNRDEEDYYIRASDWGAHNAQIHIKTIDEFVNEGEIKDQSNLSVILEGRKVFDNKGTIDGYNFNLNSKQAIYNSGSILSNNMLSFSSDYDIYNSSKINANSIVFTAQEGRMVNTSEILVGHYIHFNGHDFDNQGNITSGEGQYLVDGIFNNDGNIITTDNELAIVTQDLYNNGGLKSNDEMLLSTEMPFFNGDSNEGKMVNRGTIEANKVLNIAVNELNNDSNGKISSGEALNIGKNFNDDGTITGKSQSVNNQSGTIEAKSDLTIGAEQINNGGEISSGKNLTLQAHDVNNSKLINATDITIIAEGKVTNQNNHYNDYFDYRDAVIEAAQELNINAKQDIENTGILKGGNTTLVSEHTINNNGGRISGKNITLTSTGTDVDVGIRNSDLDHSSGQIGIESTTSSINITSEGQIINKAAIGNDRGDTSEGSNQDINISSSHDIINNYTINGKNVTLTSKQSVLSTNKLRAKNDLTIQADKDVNTGYYAYSEHDINVTAGGKITTGRWLTGKANTNLNGKQGIDFNSMLGFSRNVSLTSDKVINLSDGFIDVDSIYIKAGDVNNSIGLGANRGVTIKSNGKVTNSGGIYSSDYDEENDKIIFSDNVYINAEKGIDNQGEIYAKNLYLRSQQTINNDSVLLAENLVDIKSHDMSNIGEIDAKYVTHTGKDGRFVNAGNINASGVDSNVSITAHDFDNKGTITAGEVLDVEAISLNNSGKMKSYNIYLTTTKFVEPKYDDINNISPNEGVMANSGTIEAGKRLAIGVNTLENSGNISSGGELSIGEYLEIHDNPDPDSIFMLGIAAGKAGTVNNLSGTIEAKGDLTISVEDKLINSGLIQTNGTMSIAANGMLINSGRIKSADTMNLALNMLNNTDGTIYSGGAINIGKDLNEDGTITGRATMVNNLFGSIEAADDITIDALYYLYSTD
ncbi:filamentous hemagglutinin N-terminal domain-containing protein [Orbus sturtevantii]|uniref:two-partner secretion domain-containing protein n=1 Tax=Orbus sturtevantii TaxID=3074109 RepID=UPI00370D885B